MATDGAVADGAAADEAAADEAAAAISAGGGMEPPLAPETTELPMPTFFHRHRRGLHRTARMASQPLADWRSASDGGGSGSALSRSSSRASEDPWLWRDPWMTPQPRQDQRYANWSSSEDSSRASRTESSEGSWHRVERPVQERHVYWADEVWNRSGWMDSGWDDSSSSDWSGRSQDWGWTGQNHNWETDSSQSERSWKSEESSTSWRSAQSEQRQTLRAGRDRGDQAAELYPGRGEGVGVYAGDWGTSSVGLPVQRAAGLTVPPGQPSSEQESDPEGNGQLPSPMSPAAHMTEAWNKPSGNIPSGQPSVA